MKAGKGLELQSQVKPILIRHQVTIQSIPRYTERITLMRIVLLIGISVNVDTIRDVIMQMDIPFVRYAIRRLNSLA